MKFGKTLREQILKEWRFYAVDYKAMKKTLKVGNNDEDVGIESFFHIFETSKEHITKFYNDKEQWALEYINTLEDRVQALRKTKTSPPSPADSDSNPVSSSSVSSSDSEADDMETLGKIDSEECSSRSPSVAMELSIQRNLSFGSHRRFSANSSWLKDEYRRVGKSTHFKNFIYAKKSLATFERELDLLLDFLSLNKKAFSKILKKYDKRTRSVTREQKMAELLEELPFLEGEVLSGLKEKVSSLIDEVNSLKPRLPEGWEDRKVYTIGCFDLFHRGHQNVLLSLREFGYFIVAGIHDDESYFKLKNKYTIDNLETRMANVKPFVDQLFVIPSTDPLLYIKSMVSQQDIDMGSCCYARGDDMLQFPGREWVETVMPVHFVPRTESCSSTLLRTIYHAEDEGLRTRAAFAKTRYDGKPVDEKGNVLKLKA